VARLWRAGKTLAEAASELSRTYRKVTFAVLISRWRKKYPGGCWLGPAKAFWYENPTFGDPEDTFAPRTSPITAEEIEQMGLQLKIRYNDATTSRTDWMWNRVKLLNPDLVGQLESLLRQPGNMYHVSPPAPGASLCLCVLFVCVVVLLSFIVIYLDFVLFIYWECCSVVRQLTLSDHADGDKFWWFHKHLLVASGSLPQDFSVVGIFADDWLLVKYANPDLALKAVWGLEDLIIAWCTYRTHPHATLVALRTDRPPRPTPGCVGCSAHVGKARSRRDQLANLDHRHRLPCWQPGEGEV
jgi:hypothetical protein